MPTAPAWFVKEMQAFDPALRLRWSPRINLWNLERKITHGLPIETSKSDGFHDDYIRARDGYILVALIEPDKFGRHIFSTLRASDLWSNGGWEEMAKFIEELEAREEEAKWRAFDDEIHVATIELYNFLKWREGGLVFNAGVPK